jgi:hypothetical protein
MENSGNYCESSTLLGIITVGLLTTGKNMAEFPKSRHIIPVVNLPVTNPSISKLQKSQKLQKITEI